MLMVWAQVFPFVALQFHEGDETAKKTLTTFLVSCFSLWLILNIIFFCTIDLSYLGTFFGTKTGPQYTCELFKTSEEDSQRFDAVFDTRIDYSKSIHREVRQWVASNITRWKEDKPDWFNIEMIPDAFLPTAVVEAEGGKNRKRSSVSIREMIGFAEEPNRVHPEQSVDVE